MSSYRKEKCTHYPGYSVDTLGNVYGKRGQTLKYSTNHSGYAIVNLMISNKRIGKAIHTIVAEQFLTKQHNYLSQVNHKNGIKTDNSVDNLEWTTPSKNVLHRYQVLGQHNARRRRVIGVSKNNPLIKEYDFPSLSAAGCYFTPQHPNYAKTIIWKIIHNYPGRCSYRNCLWKYAE